MSKIGIVTIIDYQNYGNRLQNYATQEIFKSLGFFVKTIVNNPNQLAKIDNNISTKLKNITKMTSYEIRNKLNYKILDYFYKNLKTNKVNVFKAFTENYISETEYIISDDNIPKDLNEHFDYFITGSDQIWNPHFRNGSSIDFLTFASKNKRISYAPSFGVSEIPEQYTNSYKRWLNDLEFLSVREKAGAKIIDNLTGRKAQVVLDPTLMLTKEKWLSISKKAINKPNKEYLLTYFLGSKSKEVETIINNLAKENKLKIVNLADLKDRETYLSGPSEFIDWINSAKILFTDSFHGVVFSILLETPFIISQRQGNTPSMNSRIDTLLEKFRLESRLLKNINFNNDVFDINFDETHLILEKEREKSLRYLTSSVEL